MGMELKGKIIRTESDEESFQLLKMAIAQGWKPPDPIGILKINRVFDFRRDKSDMIKEERFDLLFGDDNSHMEKPITDILKWMRDKGYSHLNISFDEKDTEYFARAILKHVDRPYSNAKGFEYSIPKVKQVTMKEIEEKFGAPIKIIS